VEKIKREKKKPHFMMMMMMTTIKIINQTRIDVNIHTQKISPIFLLTGNPFNHLLLFQLVTMTDETAIRLPYYLR
jgi:hypothetical protein